eukprot:GHVU01074093.1.p1 GENE.GHVU01074093.1~~GHVU01074093.1.p1  ORF type:complete len:166 (-),score=11.66 GHVU01074093.1:379-876(-)
MNFTRRSLVLVAVVVACFAFADGKHTKEYVRGTVTIIDVDEPVPEPPRVVYVPVVHKAPPPPPIVHVVHMQPPPRPVVMQQKHSKGGHSKKKHSVQAAPILQQQIAYPPAYVPHVDDSWNAYAWQPVFESERRYVDDSWRYNQQSANLRSSKAHGYVPMSHVHAV